MNRINRDPNKFFGLVVTLPIDFYCGRVLKKVKVVLAKKLFQSWLHSLHCSIDEHFLKKSKIIYPVMPIMGVNRKPFLKPGRASSDHHHKRSVNNFSNFLSGTHSGLQVNSLC